MIRRLHVEHLWILVVLALFGSFIALVPTPPHDFWWHLRAGQIVATEGIPNTNRFAWTLPSNTPFVYATWLGEWLFYGITQVFGLPGVAIVRNLLGMVAFALVGVDARLRSGSWRLAALAVLLAGLLTINNLPIRTQNWAWVPFASYTCILTAYVAGYLRMRTLWLLPLLMAFWVNVHGTFVLGLALVVLYILGETVRQLLHHAGGLGWERLRGLYAAGVGTLVACCINPQGLAIFGYVSKLLVDQPVQTLIVEWQSPSFDTFSGKLFYAVTLALFAAFALARRRPSITDVIVVCAFLWLAWGGQRSVIWFAMVATPLLAQSLVRLEVAPERPAGVVGMNWVIACSLLLLVFVIQPGIKERWPWPKAYMQAFADVPGAPMIFDSTTPVAAAAYLRANPEPGARLFNEMSYGSYVIWAVPDMQVFIDPRIELYSLQQWQDYIAISEGRGAQKLLDQYGVTRVLLQKKGQAGLLAFLDAHPEHWQREYQDTRSAIYRRVGQ